MGSSNQIKSRDDTWLWEKRERLAEKQQWRCYWCGETMCRVHGCSRQLTLEHVIPVVMGGKTRPGNLRAACHKCNSERNIDLNPLRQGTVITSGDDTPRSPFEILKGLL